MEAMLLTPLEPLFFDLSFLVMLVPLSAETIATSRSETIIFMMLME
jgi:hypothetical protein